MRLTHKLSAFYEIRQFVTALTTACYQTDPEYIFPILFFHNKTLAVQNFCPRLCVFVHFRNMWKMFSSSQNRGHVPLHTTLSPLKFKNTVPYQHYPSPLPSSTACYKFLLPHSTYIQPSCHTLSLCPYIYKPPLTMPQLLQFHEIWYCRISPKLFNTFPWLKSCDSIERSTRSLTRVSVRRPISQVTH